MGDAERLAFVERLQAQGVPLDPETVAWLVRTVRRLLEDKRERSDA